MQAGAVAIDGRAILIVGEPGIGKTSLALALIDRGANLIGDDSVMLAARGGRLFASPHPQTRGLLEVRNVGLIEYAVAAERPVALLLRLTEDAPRLPDGPGSETVGAVAIPSVALWPHSPVLALRAEAALAKHGLCV